jgi:RNA polymerase sigma-70 factor (ECF subfamily)
MDAARRRAIHEAMVRLSDGDRSAFDVLLDELWPVILSFTERGVGRGADAEDIAQEVFFKICARIADFDQARDGSSWAFGIASFEIMTHRRRQKRRREVHDESSLAAEMDHGASQEEILLQREVILAFQHAVGKLTEEDQLALGLAPGGDLSGVPTATLRKRKQRALDRLRGIWRNLYGES